MKFNERVDRKFKENYRKPFSKFLSGKRLIFHSVLIAKICLNTVTIGLCLKYTGEYYYFVKSANFYCEQSIIHNYYFIIE